MRVSRPRQHADPHGYVVRFSDVWARSGPQSDFLFKRGPQDFHRVCLAKKSGGQGASFVIRDRQPPPSPRRGVLLLINPSRVLFRQKKPGGVRTSTRRAAIHMSPPRLLRGLGTPSRVAGPMCCTHVLANICPALDPRNDVIGGQRVPPFRRFPADPAERLLEANLSTRLLVCPSASRYPLTFRAPLAGRKQLSVAVADAVDGAHVKSIPLQDPSRARSQKQRKV